MNHRTPIAIFLAAPLAACAASPADLLLEASAVTSQTLCTKTFVSGIPAETAFREHLLPEPGMGFIAWAVRYDLDRERQELRTTVAGGFPTRSVHSAGRGCTLVARGTQAPVGLPPPPAVTAELSPIAGPEIVAPASTRLAAAIDAAFEEPGGQPRRTKAIVVVHRGRVIGERYAEGIGPDTPLFGHSMTKSVMHALYGVLARDGVAQLSDPVALPGDGEHAPAKASVEDLFRMRAGYDFDEGSGSAPATRMWYLEQDGARFAASMLRPYAVGARWAYSSGSFMQIARIVADKAGGTPLAFRDFAYRELFGPLGMTTAQFEFDPVGTPMGAHGMLASPRDWAKFGLLYLQDGVVAGRRVLPEGWVANARTPTGDSGYGAAFWLNTTDARIPEWNIPWGLPGAPPDAFMARGYMGQYTVIVPSADLVVVRMGQTHGHNSDAARVGKLVSEAVAAIGAP